ncbi:MAG: hypothetical protein E7334_08630 [Clostridiales bacterium]|nr:hypothetical protein [Clostridiales bacterium]
MQTLTAGFSAVLCFAKTCDIEKKNKVWYIAYVNLKHKLKGGCAMRIIVDAEKIIGKIKPMHGVGQPPFAGTNFSMFKYLKDAGIPYSRLHDVGGAYGGYRWVDIPNIFRDFDNDPTDPNSYDFEFTDLLIKALFENEVEPFFRLGVTIENDAMIKAYRIYPPADYKKWAVICEHIIRHYTEGWANGFEYDIKYWEIWNEPDNYEDIYENQMWRGTKQQYYELYEIASKHLKKCFPHLKIGGYASCGFYDIVSAFVSSAKSSPRMEYFIEFFDGFLEHVKKNDCPLDFFSWHSYDNIENNRIYAKYARARLDEAGFTHTETTCNEWNSEVEKRGTAHHAAVTCAMMIAFQQGPLDSAMFYDARYGTGIYGSMFNPLTKEPFLTYYAFKAFDELYQLGSEVETTVDESGVYAMAARKDNQLIILIANPLENEIPLDIKVNGTIRKCVLTSGRGLNMQIDKPQTIDENSFLLVYADID